MSELCVQHLLQKHRELEKALDKLDSLLLELANNPSGNVSCESFLCVTKLLGSHLDCLLRKKDEVLFPALEAFLPHNLGPLAVLRADEARLRLRFACMQQAAKSLAEDKGERPFWKEFQSAGRDTLQILRDAIYKQDRVLFPMVARLLSAEQDAHLLQQMEKVDGDGRSRDRMDETPLCSPAPGQPRFSADSDVLG